MTDTQNSILAALRSMHERDMTGIRDFHRQFTRIQRHSSATWMLHGNSFFPPNSLNGIYTTVLEQLSLIPHPIILATFLIQGMLMYVWKPLNGPIKSKDVYWMSYRPGFSKLASQTASSFIAKERSRTH